MIIIISKTEENKKTHVCWHPMGGQEIRTRTAYVEFLWLFQESVN